MKPGCRQCFQLNDIHGHVIKTKPTEHLEGSGEYKVNEVGLIHTCTWTDSFFKFLEGLLLCEKPEAQ